MSLQNSDTALALESPQPLVLASSSSQNDELRASTSQRVEEVTAPPAQPEMERPKLRPREFKFNGTRRVPSSYSSVRINREERRPSDVYRKQLSSLYHGIALWNPDPVKKIYNQVSIGDVGYVNRGYFYRMFNVTLPWDHPSNNKLCKAEPYEPLDYGQFSNSLKTPFAKGDYYTTNVSSEKNIDNLLVQDPHE